MRNQEEADVESFPFEDSYQSTMLIGSWAIIILAEAHYLIAAAIAALFLLNLLSANTRYLLRTTTWFPRLVVSNLLVQLLTLIISTASSAGWTLLIEFGFPALLGHLMNVNIKELIAQHALPEFK